MLIDYSLLGQRIRCARKRKSYTQEQLAESLSVSIVYISQIENGKTKLSLEMLVSIAILLDVEPGWLLTGTILNLNEAIPHEVSTILQNSTPKKLRLITDFLKLIDKY
jgi:transcriptional regulator with XRE-family HTH domain